MDRDVYILRYILVVNNKDVPMTQQEAYMQRMEKRKPKHKVGITIAIAQEVKDKRLKERVADIYRRVCREEEWLMNWRLKNKKN